jgi:hypothetical protein
MGPRGAPVVDSPPWTGVAVEALVRRAVAADALVDRRRLGLGARGGRALPARLPAAPLRPREGTGRRGLRRGALPAHRAQPHALRHVHRRAQGRARTALPRGLRLRGRARRGGLLPQGPQAAAQGRAAGLQPRRPARDGAGGRGAAALPHARRVLPLPNLQGRTARGAPAPDAASSAPAHAQRGVGPGLAAAGLARERARDGLLPGAARRGRAELPAQGPGPLHAALRGLRAGLQRRRHAAQGPAHPGPAAQPRPARRGARGRQLLPAPRGVLGRLLQAAGRGLDRLLGHRLRLAQAPGAAAAAQADRRGHVPAGHRDLARRHRGVRDQEVPDRVLGLPAAQGRRLLPEGGRPRRLVVRGAEDRRQGPAVRAGPRLHARDPAGPRAHRAQGRHRPGARERTHAVRPRHPHQPQGQRRPRAHQRLQREAALGAGGARLGARAARARALAGPAAGPGRAPARRAARGGGRLAHLRPALGAGGRRRAGARDGRPGVAGPRAGRLLQLPPGAHGGPAAAGQRPGPRRAHGRRLGGGGGVPGRLGPQRPPAAGGRVLSQRRARAGEAARAPAARQAPALRDRGRRLRPAGQGRAGRGRGAHALQRPRAGLRGARSRRRPETPWSLYS